jgi:hypothetical protein
MLRLTPLIVAALAVVGSGVVHGVWTGRWAAPTDHAEMAARMKGIGLQLGDWEGEEMDADPKQQGVAGYIARRYVNRASGQVVVITLIAGRGGPMSVHTPDVCYAGSGFEVAAPVGHTVRGEGLPPADFKTSLFARTASGDRSYLRIFWSWGHAGRWAVSDNPRLAFARHPLLYKLYVLRELASPNEALDADPCLDLMEKLLPELDRSLFKPA